MFNAGEKVRTSNEVSAKDRDILKANGIKPGTKGIVVSEMAYVTVNFDGKLVTLSDLSLDSDYDASKLDDSKINLDAIKDMFGMH